MQLLFTVQQDENEKRKNRSLMVFIVCKNRRSPCGELDGEVLRQLGELAKSEEAATEPAGVDQLPPPWGSSDYAAIGYGDLGALGAEAICAAAILHVPPYQVWNFESIFYADLSS